MHICTLTTFHFVCINLILWVVSYHDVFLFQKIVQRYIIIFQLNYMVTSRDFITIIFVMRVVICALSLVCTQYFSFEPNHNIIYMFCSFLNNYIKQSIFHYYYYFTYKCIILYWAYVIYTRGGGRCTLTPLDWLNGSLLLSLWYFLSVPLLAGDLMYIPVPDLVIYTGMAKGLRWSEGVVWS